MRDLIVKKIKSAPECSGPMVFQVFWECENCGSQNAFQKQFSLLPSQSVTCASCGGSYRYRYPSGYFKKIWDRIPELTAFEERLFHKVYEDGDDSLKALGKNLFFVISSQVLSGQKGGDVG